MKEVKTDNTLTLVVMETQKMIHDFRKELREQWRIPFMEREVTKYEKSKGRQNGQWY